MTKVKTTRTVLVPAGALIYLDDGAVARAGDLLELPAADAAALAASLSVRDVDDLTPKQRETARAFMLMPEHERLKVSYEAFGGDEADLGMARAVARVLERGDSAERFAAQAVSKRLAASSAEASRLLPAALDRLAASLDGGEDGPTVG